MSITAQDEETKQPQQLDDISERKKMRAAKMLINSNTTKQNDIFQSIYDTLSSTQFSSDSETIISKIRYLLESNGFLEDDPRIMSINETLS